jgi:hypothetical protein
LNPIASSIHIDQRANCGSGPPPAQQQQQQQKQAQRKKGAGAAAAAAMLFKPATVKVKPVKDVAAAVTQAESLVARAKDFHELENLESAYGYYLDKNLPVAMIVGTTKI